jgi:hypothetical protein
MMPKGQFDPNPFHMLRAQSAAAAGQPIKVPPNRPSAGGKFPPKTAVKDALIAIYRLRDFNPNHDDKGLFSSGPLGGSESEAFNTAFAKLAARYPDQLATRVSKIAAVASQVGGDDEDESQGVPEHEKAAKEAAEHWQQLGRGVRAFGEMTGGWWAAKASKSGDTDRTKAALAKAVQSGASTRRGLRLRLGRPLRPIMSPSRSRRWLAV